MDTKQTTCLFIGNHEIHDPGLEERVREQLEHLIVCGVRTFLNGGMGAFDRLCAHRLSLCRCRHSGVRSLLVVPWLNDPRFDATLFDEVVFPGLEGCPRRAAIVRRNRWMVEHASIALCYVPHTTGGAGDTLEYAVKKGLWIVRLDDPQTLSVSASPTSIIWTETQEECINGNQQSENVLLPRTMVDEGFPSGAQGRRRGG